MDLPDNALPGQTSFIGVYGENVIDQDEWTFTFTYDGGNDPRV